MTRKVGQALSLAVATSILVVSVGTTASPAAQTAKIRYSDEDLQATFGQVCAQCHDEGSIRAVRRTRAGWTEVIDKMIVQQGAVGTDEDFELVLQYLLRSYGLVNVNTAPSEDIEAVLALTEKAARDVVTFREANGKFQDLDALAKVPGIDPTQLASKKRAISF